MDNIKKEQAKRPMADQPEEPAEGKSLDQRILDEQRLSGERQQEGKARLGLEVEETRAKQNPETRNEGELRKPTERRDAEP